MPDTHQQWFKDAKYGLFIHWGLYSILAGEYKGRRTDNISEWIMKDLNIPVEEYEKLAKQLNPKHFCAEEYVQRAKKWGMRYLVFTSKHHEGFAMYHSKASTYNVVDASPYGRDIVKELSKACKKHGIKFCLYYSQAQEWHDPNGYMAHRDNYHIDFEQYLQSKCIPQLRELLTGYGEIGLIWFDTPLNMTAEQSRRLVEVVKSIQPNCIISGRIGNGLGEYMTTSDNFIPSGTFYGDWEVPCTLNDTWGYSRFDHNWKSAEYIIRKLIIIASRGGNCLLNVGPDGDGVIPEASIEVLDKVGNYLRKNGESIYGTCATPPYVYDVDDCYFTAKPHRLFIHLMRPACYLELHNIANKVHKATLLASGQELEIISDKTCEGVSSWRINLPSGHIHDIDSVFCVEYAEEWPVYEPLR